MKRRKFAILLLSALLSIAIAGNALAALSITFNTSGISTYRVSLSSINRDSGQPWYTFEVDPSTLSYTGSSRNTAYATPCSSGGSVGYADRLEITPSDPTSYECYPAYRYEVNVWVALRNGFYTDSGNSDTTTSMSISGTFSGQY